MRWSPVGERPNERVGDELRERLGREHEANGDVLVHNVFVALSLVHLHLQDDRELLSRSKDRQTQVVRF